MLINEISASILLAVLIAVLIKGKIDNMAHLLGLITIMLGFPGTLLIVGGVIVYNLFNPLLVVPWHLYIALVVFMGLGEFLDVVIRLQLFRTETLANVVKLIVAIAMVVLFWLNV